jgi:hypothetical protein
MLWGKGVAEPIGKSVTEKFGGGPGAEAAGRGTTEALEQALGFLGGRVKAPPAAKPLTQAQEAAQAVRGQGYALPPTQVNPTMTNRMVEGYGGKWSTQQEIALKDQEITNAKVRKDLGLPEGSALNTEVMEKVRREAHKDYKNLLEESQQEPVKNVRKAKVINEQGKAVEVPIEELPDRIPGMKAAEGFKQGINAEIKRIEGLQAESPEVFKTMTPTLRLLRSYAKREEFTPEVTFNEIQRLRDDAKSNFRVGGPNRTATARTQLDLANRLEDVFEEHLGQTGKQDLVDRFRAARTRMAKSYSVEDALNPVTGNVDARKIAAMDRPFTGGLKDIYNFGNVGKKVAAPPETFGGHPGLNPLDAAAALVSGKPGVFGALAMRPQIAKMAASDWYQNRFVKPNAPGAISMPPWLIPLLAQQNQSQ